MQDLRKFVLIIIMAVVAALVLMGGWYTFFAPKNGNGQDFRPITVEAEEARRGSIVRTVTVVGTLRADNEVTIHPEIEGKIKNINFVGGSLVQQGDALIEIDDSVYAAQLKEAEATLSFATSELERYTRLAETQSGPARRREQAEAEKAQAEAKRELAQIRLNNTVIRAPFSGLIGLKKVSQGSFVDPRTELLTIVDVDPIKVDFKLPARYLKSISRGQDVTLELDSFPGETFSAQIDAIDPVIDSSANSVLVRGIIPNREGRLKPGLFARVSLVVGSKDNALLVPESAVLSRIDEEHVYRVVTIPVQGVDQTLSVKVPVTTGLSEGGVIEIVRGLSEGDLIVTVGRDKIRDRYPVRVVDDVQAAEEFDFDEEPASEQQTDQGEDEGDDSAANDEE